MIREFRKNFVQISVTWPFIWQRPAIRTRNGRFITVEKFSAKKTEQCVLRDISNRSRQILCRGRAFILTRGVENATIRRPTRRQPHNSRLHRPKLQGSGRQPGAQNRRFHLAPICRWVVVPDVHLLHVQPSLLFQRNRRRSHHPAKSWRDRRIVKSPTALHLVQQGACRTKWRTGIQHQGSP